MHIPVLLQELLEHLVPQHNRTYVDCTFGTGGYTKAILQHNCNVIAIDQDPEVAIYANIIKKQYGKKFQFYNTNFINLHSIIMHPVDGIIFDLGTSMLQLKTYHRGFSFQTDSKLDMRMNPEISTPTAKDLINTTTERQLSDIIYKYGGERNARKIAKVIHSCKSNIHTTLQLAKIIHDAIGSDRYGKIDSATKTFQALRIVVNNELNNFTIALENITPLLICGSKLIVVSFHSLEDRIIKNFLRRNVEKKIAKSKYNKISIVNECISEYKVLTKKPITASQTEINNNPSARSAKMRIAQKII